MKRMAYVTLFLVSPEFKRHSECLVLEDVKMITCSNVWFIGSVAQLCCDQNMPDHRSSTVL